MQTWRPGQVLNSIFWNIDHIDKKVSTALQDHPRYIHVYAKYNLCKITINEGSTAGTKIEYTFWILWWRLQTYQKHIDPTLYVGPNTSIRFKDVAKYGTLHLQCLILPAYLHLF